MSIPPRSWQKPSQTHPHQQPVSPPINTPQYLSPYVPPIYPPIFTSPFTQFGGIENEIVQVLMTIGMGKPFIIKAGQMVYQIIHELKIDNLVISLWKKIEEIPITIPIKKMFWKIYIMLVGEEKKDRSGYLFLIGIFLMIPYLHRKFHNTTISFH
ncbi:hypothetical protein EDI_145280 [Entamoeba dispar SAW760]|uniref:Uncharacterized protein n=1 Tax=Entamoeba dispar (strain ATCC PRA-260 / SAW760) TaxID=370354 RepID=B0E5N5_ENTDS|nr:uncharacterized protein EDI_145280 [Entamoeba dispar SAW760]EDR30165.1 hypothetical protein EDI_145280 [Entamoeba dispar SAW760]|eukprot:EDR30165.1 hypothetical protein EDI_145280 [Entamoeba dispar SAW760]